MIQWIKNLFKPKSRVLVLHHEVMEISRKGFRTHYLVTWYLNNKEVHTETFGYYPNKRAIAAVTGYLRNKYKLLNQ